MNTVSAVKPVLVTGSPRSGTTWMGKMLAAAEELHYVHEPFNPHSEAPELGRLRFQQHFAYLGKHNESRYRGDLARVVRGEFDLWHGLSKVRRVRQIKSVLAQRAAHKARLDKGVQVVFKDPIALMSADWLMNNFDMRCVVMIRHPAAFVASINRLEWNSRPYRWALAQPELMARRLAPFTDELAAMRDAEAADPDSYDVIDQAAMAWKLHHHVIRELRTSHPDWLFLHHEDVAGDPIPQFQKLYGKLGLQWSPALEAEIGAHSAAQNPDRAAGKEKALRLNSAATVDAWRDVLSDAELEKIRTRVAGVVEDFYPDTRW